MRLCSLVIRIGSCPESTRGTLVSGTALGSLTSELCSEERRGLTVNFKPGRKHDKHLPVALAPLKALQPRTPSPFTCQGCLYAGHPTVSSRSPQASRAPKRGDSRTGGGKAAPPHTPSLYLPAGLAHSQTSVPDCKTDQVMYRITTAFSLLIKENSRKSTHKIFMEISQISNNRENA